MTPGERLTQKEIQISILVWEGLTNREIGRLSGRRNRSSRIILQHLRQIGCLEPTGTGYVCRKPRRQKLARLRHCRKHLPPRDRSRLAPLKSTPTEAPRSSGPLSNSVPRLRGTCRIERRPYKYCKTFLMETIRPSAGSMQVPLSQSLVRRGSRHWNCTSGKSICQGGAGEPGFRDSRGETSDGL